MILAIYLTATITFTLVWALIGYARGPVRTNHTASFARHRRCDAGEIGAALQHVSPKGK